MAKDLKKYDYFNQLNGVRQSPRTVLSGLQEVVACFTPDNTFQKNGKIYKSKEGRRVWCEAVEFVGRQQALRRLQWCEGLYLAAKEYAKLIISNNTPDPFELAQKYVKYAGEIKIWTSFGCTDTRQFLQHAIVSDGDKSRDQRLSIFNNKFLHCGAYSCKHPAYGNMLVYFLAQKITEKNKIMQTGSRLINQINLVRADPLSYIPEIVCQLSQFRNNTLQLNNQETIQTVEGKKAWLDCIDFLSNVKPVHEIGYARSLNHISVEQMRFPETDFAKLVKRFPNVKGKAKFIQSIGIKDPKQIVLSLLISDGDENRGARNTLFSRDINFGGGFIILNTGEERAGLLLVQNVISSIKGDNRGSSSISRSISSRATSLSKFKLRGLQQKRDSTTDLSGSRDESLSRQNRRYKNNLRILTPRPNIVKNVLSEDQIQLQIREPEKRKNVRNRVEYRMQKSPEIDTRGC